MSKSDATFLVAIDTQTLIWAVRKDGTAEELERAEWLFEQLEVEKAQVVIPSVVIAEYLGPIPKSKHAATIEAINRRFLIKPFDVECASLASELFNIGKPMRPSGIPLGREVLRADTLIIATAKVHKAKVFYSNDKDCLALAKKVLDARPLPINSPYLTGMAQKESKRRTKPR